MVPKRLNLKLVTHDTEIDAKYFLVRVLYKYSATCSRHQFLTTNKITQLVLKSMSHAKIGTDFMTYSKTFNKNTEHKRTSSNCCMSQNANYAITVTNKLRLSTE